MNIPSQSLIHRQWGQEDRANTEDYVQVMRRTRLAVTVLSALAAALGVAALPAVAESAAPATSPAAGSATPMAVGPQHGDTKQVCPVSAKPGSVTCQAIIKLVSAARNAPAVTGPDAQVAYGPGSLR